MYRINKLNAISDAILGYLPDTQYEISTEFEKYEAIIVRSAKCHEMQFPKELLAIARAGAGVNNIPIDRCTDEGICVFNTPGANANGVKELVIASMLATTRNLVEGSNWAQSLVGQDDVPALVEKGKKQFVGPEIAGKKLGVIGLGAIGAMVANSCSKLGMKVYGFDPYVSVEAAWMLDQSIVRAVKIETIFTECDYITIHVPLNDKTRNLISEDQFAMMKKDVVLLNFSRGGLVDVAALKEAIADGTIKKYVIDFPDAEVLGNDHILAIPHLGASTPESEENCAIMAAKELNNYIQYGNIQNSVNLPDCSLPYSGNFRLTLIHGNEVNVVGQVTKILGDNKINIEDMINKGGKSVAYTIIDTNKEVDSTVIKAISEIDAIIRIRTISH